MKSTAKSLEEELNKEVEEENERILWKRDARGNTVTRIRMVYPRNNSNI